MGIYLSKPIIIEFNGLPGSGKTTVNKLLQERLNELNIKSCFRYYKKTFHRNVFSVLFSLRYGNVKKAICHYSKSFPTKKGKKNILSYVSYLRMYNDFIKGKGQGALLIDQGLIQSLISLAHKDSISCCNDLFKLLKLSKLNSIPIILINCLINVEESKNRIKARRSMGARVDAMEDTEMLATLSIQYSNFICVRNAIRDLYPDLTAIDIDMRKSSEENVELIIKQLQLVGVLESTN